ncbi:DUF2254 domain-containing protein [Hyphobacterium sp.]|jgi:uncharacterized membrane protein|uniref:DUF2254 domain-containing protein n=1 Tax=Hyphobacterium sp. TaxID=2004662 RepID=UPI003BA9AF3D
MLSFHLRRIWQSIWFLPAVYAVAAVMAVVITPVIGQRLPSDWVELVEIDALAATLNILASSMLAVAIFSMATMFSAFQAAANSATPRARPLMTQDRTAQSAISTFVGAFLFSLLGLIGINSGLYGESGLLVLFVLTLLLVVHVVVMLIRWINRLSGFGGVEEAITVIEAATRKSVKRESECANFGASHLPDIPKTAHAVEPHETGHVQTIDIPALQTLAEDEGVKIYLPARPGSLVGPGAPAAFVLGSKEIDEKVLGQIIIHPRRTLEEDPAFGLITLAEIASRALSPSVNDPGTALSAIAAMTRLLCGLSGRFDETADNPADRVFMAPLDPHDLLVDAFRPIARDGADKVEVGIRLQKALGMLVSADEAAFGEPAQAISAHAIERAKAALGNDTDLKALKAACPF